MFQFVEHIKTIKTDIVRMISFRCFERMHAYEKLDCRVRGVRGGHRL